MTDTKNLYDAVIIGGGPAGLTAALYLGRARYRVLVLEKDRFGGQITITNEVVNYPGVLAASGEELAGTMRQQAANFGAEFKMAEVTGLEMAGDVKIVHTNKGDVQALSVLLASGASPRHVGFDGEEDYQGHGVAYCATCDGEFFTGKEVLVVGGGFAAAEESVFLTKYAKHVTILVRGDDFSCAASTAEPAKKHPKITVRYNTRIVRVSGDTGLRSAVLENTKTKERETWHPEQEGDTFGIFVLSGYVPATGLVTDIAEVDERGYVITDEHNMTTCDRSPLPSARQQQPRPRWSASSRRPRKRRGSCPRSMSPRSPKRSIMARSRWPDSAPRRAPCSTRPCSPSSTRCSPAWKTRSSSSCP